MSLSNDKTFGKASRDTVIDGMAFARDGRRLSLVIDVANFDRLAGLLMVTKGAIVKFSIEGGKGSSEPDHYLDLSVGTTLVLQCQRCLNECILPIDLRRRLGLVHTETDIPDDDLHDDSKDVIVAGREMSVLRLIEDELILALPMVVLHETCSAPAVG